MAGSGVDDPELLDTSDPEQSPLVVTRVHMPGPVVVPPLVQVLVTTGEQVCEPVDWVTQVLVTGAAHTGVVPPAGVKQAVMVSWPTPFEPV